MQRAIRFRTLLAPTCSSYAARSLRSARLYATTSPNGDESATASTEGNVTSGNWPLGITSEMLEQAKGRIDMKELLAQVEEMEDGQEADSEAVTLEDMYDLDSTLEEFKGDDSTSMGHHMLRNRREILQYFRLIELELPTLHALRKPFTPPSPTEAPVIARTMTYGGIKHPVQRKAALVVPISRLPLANDAAVHKFKVLAGTRWSIEPPKDAGLGKEEVAQLSEAEHGYFKISHEGFPELAMNLKWCSDTLDQLITESNNSKDSFADIPLDTRHLSSQARKRRKGQQRLGANGEEVKRATIEDFPKEWLPSEGQVRKLRKWLAAKQRKAAASRRVPIYTQQPPPPSEPEHNL